ncbi:MAG: DinB family protein [Bryobacteraceae bacterium]
MPQPNVEPPDVERWLGGPLPGVDPLLAPIFYSFEQTRLELRLHSEGLTPVELWRKPFGLTPAGFHIRHIGGAADRLSTYLRGESLSDGQLAFMKLESQPGASRAELLGDLDAHLGRCEAIVRLIDPASLREPRTVGRKKLPTTVNGLIVHIAEHTLRHLGQAITTMRLVRAAGPEHG